MESSKCILTLDAGGTNFVFSALKYEKEIVAPVTVPAEAHDLKKSLSNLIAGFEKVISMLNTRPDAISFAFPGPADYPNGILGNLPNFSAFNGGVALGPMLEHHFSIPVFINNDGDLFAFGEAMKGCLPEINRYLESAGNPKRYQNMVGLTIGTGFGCGIVIGGRLVTGDNSCGGGIHATLNPGRADWNAEESVSTRAIKRVYAEQSGCRFDETPTPEEIFRIAMGELPGDREASRASFEEFGAALGYTVANIVTLIDSNVVIGGGLTGSWELFAPAMFRAMRKKFVNFRGEPMDRMSVKVYDLEDEQEKIRFLEGNPVELTVPGSGEKMQYDDSSRIGIAKSRLGASAAVGLGAYAFALRKLKEQ